MFSGSFAPANTSAANSSASVVKDEFLSLHSSDAAIRKSYYDFLIKMLF